MQTTDAALFVSMNAGGPEGGHRMNVRAVRDMWDELQRRLNIKRPGRSVHGLRHAYATRIMMEDPSALMSLSLSMGHSGVTITQGYLEAAKLIGDNPAKSNAGAGHQYNFSFQRSLHHASKFENLFTLLL
jgi:integrase